MFADFIYHIFGIIEVVGPEAAGVAGITLSKALHVSSHSGQYVQ